METAYGQDLDMDISKVALAIDNDWAKDYQKICDHLIVSLANNHILDGGDEGVRQLLQYLDERDIGYCGIGLKGSDLHNPYIIEDEGRRLGLLSYVLLPGMEAYQKESDYEIAIFTKERFLKDIQKLLDQKALPIILMHWGIEEASSATAKQKELAHWMIEQKAEMIIGHHTHSIQEHEVYMDKHIFYSIGNFYFPDFAVRAFAHPKNPQGIIYRKRQLPWNKEGLVLDYGLKLHIQRIYFNNHQLQVDPKAFVYKPFPFVKLQLYYRKILSMIYSNTRTEKGLIDWAYFQNEWRLLMNKRRSS